MVLVIVRMNQPLNGTTFELEGEADAPGASPVPRWSSLVARWPSPVASVRFDEVFCDVDCVLVTLSPVLADEERLSFSDVDDTMLSAACGLVGYPGKVGSIQLYLRRGVLMQIVRSRRGSLVFAGLKHRP